MVTKNTILHAENSLYKCIFVELHQDQFYRVLRKERLFAVRRLSQSIIQFNFSFFTNESRKLRWSEPEDDAG